MPGLSWLVSVSGSRAIVGNPSISLDTAVEAAMERVVQSSEGTAYGPRPPTQWGVGMDQQLRTVRRGPYRGSVKGAP